MLIIISSVDRILAPTSRSLMSPSLEDQEILATSLRLAAPRRGVENSSSSVVERYCVL